jgi:hypothetical protein
MKAIKFTDQELETTIEIYQVQLELAKMEVAAIQEILKKLGGGSEKSVVTEKSPKQKRGRKPSVKTVETREPKKRGRKARVTPPVVEPAALIAAPVQKTKKTPKVAALKKPVTKPTPKKKSKVKPVVAIPSAPEPKATPKKEIASVVKKKSAVKQKTQQKATPVKKSKPAVKKVAKTKPAAGTTTVEPVAAPAEQS